MFKFMAGLFLGLSLATAGAQMVVDVTNNGVLKDYIVQKDGKDICRDPLVWSKPFRANLGPEGYIVCPDE